MLAFVKHFICLLYGLGMMRFVSVEASIFFSSGSIGLASVSGVSCTLALCRITTGG